jgi:hypothetical protein
LRKPQNGQSARFFFLQSSEFGPPTPSPAGECILPLTLRFRGGGVTHTLACGRGGGRGPIRTRGSSLWYCRYACIYICTLWHKPRKDVFLGKYVTFPAICCTPQQFSKVSFHAWFRPVVAPLMKTKTKFGSFVSHWLY